MQNKLNLIIILSALNALHASNLPTLETATPSAQKNDARSESKPLIGAQGRFMLVPDRKGGTCITFFSYKSAATIQDQPRISDLERRGWKPTGKTIIDDEDGSCCSLITWIKGEGCTFKLYYRGNAYGKKTKCCSKESCLACCESHFDQCCSHQQY